MSISNPEILSRLNQARIPRAKKAPSPPAKQSEKKKESVKHEKQERAGGRTEKEQWFLDRRKEMTGNCWHCGGKSCKNADMYFRNSIAHILPKSIFKSVAYHPLNWIELCFWDPSCHTNFDNHTLDVIDLNCFDTVIERFVKIYPEIDAKERKHIPDILLQYVEVER